MSGVEAREYGIVDKVIYRENSGTGGQRPTSVKLVSPGIAVL